jgi:hypothetical protein
LTDGRRCSPHVHGAASPLIMGADVLAIVIALVAFAAMFLLLEGLDRV